MTSPVVKTPWAEHMGDVPLHLNYFEGSLFEAVERVAKQYPNNIAFDFMGRATTYRELMQRIETCAGALLTLGIKAGDRVTLALPNCPQAVCLLYALNRMGAVANIIHPLSAEKEIEFYFNKSDSVAAVILDTIYHKVEAVRARTKVDKLLLVSIEDELSLPARVGYRFTQKYKKGRIFKDDPSVLSWKAFLRRGDDRPAVDRVVPDPHDTAVILYSGGTTGTTKGILLTNRNLNALGQQLVATNPMFRVGDRMLAAMPLFHGFGLGVCVHAMLSQGGRCILVPRFTAKSYLRQMAKYKCNFIAGVPTLFEALLRLPHTERVDLSSLKGVFSGGDSLSVALKTKFDKFLCERKATVQVREGYGTTETVAACCLTPHFRYKKGSIGLPFPDTYMKIVRPGTDEELPYGQEGEILLAGPTVMKAYMNQPEETAETLRRHADGLTWVYTGDIGTMDSEGFVYFRGRAKRMIVSSGYNVYPGQIENILDAHEGVARSCVIGVPDPYKMQKVKAFVQLSPGVPATWETEEELLVYCRKHIAKYAMPYRIEFREDMPKTLVGKVAYRILEEEERVKAEGEREQS